MNRRPHEVLDGEGHETDLTEMERRQLQEYRSAVHAALEALPDDPAPDLAAAVMTRIEAEAAPDRRSAAGTAGPKREARGFGERIRGNLAWLWSPRPVSVTLRPMYGLVAVGAVAALTLFATADTPAASGPANPPVASAEGSTVPARETVLVHFRLDAPDAESVRLAGDFTKWEPSVSMHEQLPGVWSVVVPLEPGVHDYAFVVDGREWRPDPLAQQVDDGFGGTNSRLALPTPAVS